ncbi:hypothetical protein Sjap_023857 [Stephania japonica]|uniref:Uncharacterized protein n=1 Tax=Stephania japonica TaxID=461633 RepID=A0AAP0EEG4_9MAGN
MEGIEDLPRQTILLRFPFMIRFTFVRLLLDQIYRTSSSNADFQQMAYGHFRLSAGLCRTFTISGTDGALLDQLVFMLGGFTIHPSSLAGSLAAVFQGIDANKYCNWCHDINCVPFQFLELQRESTPL